jgi:nucleotide-binding universal stress UspA family protein
MYVEDIDLLRMAELPFARAITSSGQSHSLTPETMERQLRRHADIARSAVEAAGAHSNIAATFTVVRGTVFREIERAAAAAEFVTVGRSGWSARRLGSVARSLVEAGTASILMVGEGGVRDPLAVVYDGSPAAERALALASALDGSGSRPITVIATGEQAANVCRFGSPSSFRHPFGGSRVSTRTSPAVGRENGAYPRLGLRENGGKVGYSRKTQYVGIPNKVKCRRRIHETQNQDENAEKVRGAQGAKRASREREQKAVAQRYGKEAGGDQPVTAAFEVLWPPSELGQHCGVSFAWPSGNVQSGPSESYLTGFHLRSVDGVICNLHGRVEACGAGLPSGIVIILGAANLIADGFSRRRATF